MTTQRELESAIGLFRKALADNGGDLSKTTNPALSLVAAIKDYIRTSGPGGVGDADLENATIALFQNVLRELAASQEIRVSSGSPAAGFTKALHVSGLDPDHDTLGVGAALMAKAKAHLNEQVVWTKDTPQDIGEFDHYQSHGSKVQKAADKRGNTGGAYQSPNDPTA